MSFGRVSVVTIPVALCVALLAAMVPLATLAAKGTEHEYIVTIKVKDSGRIIKPSNRDNRVRIRQRSKAARLETNEVTQRNGVKAHYRYDSAVTGFAARMTKGQARKLARDPSVSSVRRARTFGTAGQIVPDGIKRVKATAGSSGPDVQANVAVLDSGIGPANGLGDPTPMTTNELNLGEGINCYDDPFTEGDENPRYWGDVYGHGTHVAGIIGARDNAYGVVGVAPGAKLWSVRVFGSSGFGSEAAILCGLNWVIDTHDDPGNPDKIDVVNMSIEGPRTDLRETCDASLTDPMQVLICQLRVLKVPVVAAAGNDGINANQSAPGGFDQVITVAAMTDTDGVGWQDGGNATCSGMRGEMDDTFAGYSNYGSDIDIVAPGTCVRSTWYADPSGDQKATATGTSAAAPHVAGAIARYVDEVGTPDSVGAMRQLIRAAGRSDWNPKNPAWFGVNDPDPPDRVLDVAALTGDEAVKTFVFHENIDVAGSTSSVATWVDVQRSGGYDDTVGLSASPLGGSVGTSAFDTPNLDGLGKNQLGTRLVFDLNANGGEGFHDVVVTSNGSGVSPHDRSLQLTIDRTGPTVSQIGPKVRAQKTGVSKAGATQVYLQWNHSDNLTGVKSAQLQRKTDGSAWKNAGVAGTSSARVFLKPGQDNKFRVKATDGVGNVRTSYSIRARLAIRDSKNGALNRIGAWKTKPVSKAYGGSLLIATAGAATLKTKFDGKAVAILAPVGNGRGTFRVRVDGGAWHTVKTKTQTAGQRKVVWSARLVNGSHKVEIQRISGKPAIDGLIFVR